MGAASDVATLVAPSLMASKGEKQKETLTSAVLVPTVRPALLLLSASLCSLVSLSTPLCFPHHSSIPSSFSPSSFSWSPANLSLISFLPFNLLSLLLAFVLLVIICIPVIYGSHTQAPPPLFIVSFSPCIAIVYPQTESLTVHTDSLMLWMEDRPVCCDSRAIPPALAALYLHVHIYSTSMEPFLDSVGVRCIYVFEIQSKVRL